MESINKNFRKMFFYELSNIIDEKTKKGEKIGTKDFNEQMVTEYFKKMKKGHFSDNYKERSPFNTEDIEKIVSALENKGIYLDKELFEFIILNAEEKSINDDLLRKMFSRLNKTEITLTKKSMFCLKDTIRRKLNYSLNDKYGQYFQDLLENPDKTDLSGFTVDDKQKKNKNEIIKINELKEKNKTNKNINERTIKQKTDKNEVNSNVINVNVNVIINSGFNISPSPYSKINIPSENENKNKINIPKQKQVLNKKERQKENEKTSNQLEEFDGFVMLPGSSGVRDLMLNDLANQAHELISNYSNSSNSGSENIEIGNIKIKNKNCIVF